MSRPGSNPRPSDIAACSWSLQRARRRPAWTCARFPRTPRPCADAGRRSRITRSPHLRRSRPRSTAFAMARPPDAPHDRAAPVPAPLRSVRESHYREKLVHRARGLRDLDRLVGGVVDDIDAMLARRATVRVLELGCGYGTALLELRARYGGRVELHGLNRFASDGAADVLYRNALD